MQRQSLSSPVSKLHSHGGTAVAVAREDAPTLEDLKRRDSFSASPLLSNYEIGEDHKAAKLRRHSSSSLSSSRAEKFIHIIPILTLVCFLVLYLCSHSPTQADLAEFNGFKRSAKRIDDTDEIIDSVERLGELEKSNVFAIRSLRNLHEIRKKSSKIQLGRKLGDF
ncbi:hypothetical protein SAY86_021499 [Trapa natans]|uniref:Uncharacterized protein n=1 Tax=Trapa natans TaxID=22666 RepID=A0AAN7MA22_TRANT|nr:hypothetical protein SAY86_021499 [Trapa natans]